MLNVELKNGHYWMCHVSDKHHVDIVVGTQDHCSTLMTSYGQNSV